VHLLANSPLKGIRKQENLLTVQLSWI